MLENNNKMFKNYYNTILSQAFSPCGKFLFTGDYYGNISVFNLYKILNTETSSDNGEQTPINSYTVQEGVQINSMLKTEQFLVVGTIGDIFGFPWRNSYAGKEWKPQWKIEIPGNKDSLERIDINCLIYDENQGYVYAGCGDNNVYAIDITSGAIVITLSGHTDYVHSIHQFKTDLISGSEDGLCVGWDPQRTRTPTARIEPGRAVGVARAALGRWVGAVARNDDWLVCGGGPRLSLWHFRTMNHSAVFDTKDEGVHVLAFHEDKVLAGGRSPFFYQLRINGDVISEVQTSAVSVFSAVLQDSPYRVLAIAGSSPKIDICTNFNYKDLTLTT